MRDLQDILYKVNLVTVVGDINKQISTIVFDSRSIEENAVFIAINGAQMDGHEFIETAILNGANSIICEVIPDNTVEHVVYVQVKDSGSALAFMASNFYDNPSKEIKLIGITGTNGKTTTATLLYNLFMDLDYKSGLLSTVINKIGKKDIAATHTTPNPVELNRLLRLMIDENCGYCFMEVSSHAINQNRIIGLEFDIAVFTNITHDHLDYHKTFQEYIYVKKKFFDNLSSSAISIVNIDDVNGEVMVQNSKSTIKTLALKTVADYKVKIIENSFSGLVLNLNNHELYSQLIGGFNAYNILMVYAVAMELKLDEINILAGISNLKSVEGRFQYLMSDSKIIAIVDYAHTPDALKNVLKTIQTVRTRNEQVLTVFGCGGDRDKKKRPIMASIAAELSDKVILTSDNPRSENPDEIINEMKSGIPVERSANTMIITDRAEAIKVACSLAQPGDILLVAGKGHEKYQEINGERFPFDDLETLKETLKTLKK